MKHDLPMDDAQLVGRVLAGDGEAFSELFNRHRDAVAGVCAQRLKFRTDVDDAVQESFARALARLHQLRDPALFGPWMRSIAVRTCTDHHRASGRVIVLDDAGAGEIVDSAPRPDEVIERREHSAAVRATLSDLGERDRHALLMRHLANAPVAAVATELGLTEGSTRVLLTRARHRLRAAVTTLPVFVPPSWRQWLRDHLPMAAPATQALAAVVAIGVAAGGIAGGAPPPHADSRVAKVVTAGAEREATPVAEGVRRARTASAARSAPAVISSAATAPTKPAAPATDLSRESRAPLDRAVRSVEVRDRYPDESETQEVIDVTVFANDDEHTVRVYADEVTSQVEAARENLTGSSSGGSDGAGGSLDP